MLKILAITAVKSHTPIETPPAHGKVVCTERDLAVHALAKVRGHPPADGLSSWYNEPSKIDIDRGVTTPVKGKFGYYSFVIL